MNVLVIDAFDSFVHTVAQYVAILGGAPTVVRSSEITPAKVEEWAPACVLLGPGPGHPKDSGYVELLQALGDRVPMFGVCLGHQAVGLAFGGRVSRASHLMHGKASQIKHDGKGCFDGCRDGLQGMRYHSLIVEKDSVPGALEVSATSEDDGYVMGLRHRSFPVESIQFHPESIWTDDGLRMLGNFVSKHSRAENV